MLRHVAMERLHTAEIRVPPEKLGDEMFYREEVASKLNCMPSEVRGMRLVRRSLDARKRPAVFLLRFELSADKELAARKPFHLELRNVSQAEPALIAGFGPAGIFAALRLIELGIKPIVFERGKPVRKRRVDVAGINKRGIVNPESNYCFGEGGAGTFSDGKLYTRSNKRGTTERVLNIFALHGADPDILIDAHPHIGTNKLPGIIESMRRRIVECGGEIHFESKVTGILRGAAGIEGIELAGGETIRARALILAAGHSARDVFEMLERSGVEIESKPFALGVRVEHPQSLVDSFQYGGAKRPVNLPPAAYSFVAQCAGRGVFSFCMCPGGIICPAATNPGEVVVNGWSPSKRNSYFANSGIVVAVEDGDLAPYSKAGALAGAGLQEDLERRAARAGGGNQVAPAQRLTDFIAGKISQSLPRCSYHPGVTPADLAEVFPSQFLGRLRNAFGEFEKQRRGYLTEEAIVVAVESRTSSPVRIPREKTSLMHPGAPGLFPCGEGAGYAGGIMSAAMDGENCAAALARYYRS